MEHNQLAVDDYLGPLNIPMILVLLRFLTHCWKYYKPKILWIIILQYYQYGTMPLQFENWLIVIKNIWLKITLFDLMKEIPTHIRPSSWK